MTYQVRRLIRTDGEKESKESILSARFDEVDDDDEDEDDDDEDEDDDFFAFILTFRTVYSRAIFLSDFLRWFFYMILQISILIFIVIVSTFQLLYSTAFFF